MTMTASSVRTPAMTSSTHTVPFAPRFHGHGTVPVPTPAAGAVPTGSGPRPVPRPGNRLAPSTVPATPVPARPGSTGTAGPGIARVAVEETDAAGGWRQVVATWFAVEHRDQAALDGLVDDVAEAAIGDVQPGGRLRVSAATVDDAGRVVVAYVQASPCPDTAHRPR